MATILYRDACFQAHQTGMHPESPDRLRAIEARLEQAGLASRCMTATAPSLDERSILELHTREQVELVREACARGGGYLEADTVTGRESFAVAKAAAGAAAAAVDAVVEGRARNALCLVRPPGHHATPRQSMGFCLFNNIALAAQHARTAHGLSRLLIVDWDVHHGNGTQDIFYGRPDVMFYSIHRFGQGFYPGTGTADETGTGPGLGATLNQPIRYGTPRKQYRDRFLQGLERAAGRIRPELVLISAGFDAHAADPIGSLGLEAEDFAALTRDVLEVANGHAGGRVVSCLEGGYHLGALAECVEIHLRELLAASG